MVVNDKTEMKPLFLPVISEVYNWYWNNLKWYELRPHGTINGRKSPFNSSTVIPWRPIWISKGYSGARWMGVIGDVITGRLEDILAKVPYDAIIPVAKSRKEATKIINSLVPAKEYIAFEISQCGV